MNLNKINKLSQAPNFELMMLMAKSQQEGGEHGKEKNGKSSSKNRQ